MFIVFEGPDCSGKSTQVQRLVQWLIDQGIDCIATREPGGTELGERVRSLFLDDTLDDMHGMTEALLMLAQRREHLEQVIKPALANNQWVICDRFILSSIVYQGYGRGVRADRVRELTELALDGFKPDLVLGLDVSVEHTMDRLKGRGKTDRLEQADRAFYERIRQGFRSEFAAQSNVAGYTMLDGSLPIEDVADSVRQVVSAWL